MDFDSKKEQDEHDGKDGKEGKKVGVLAAQAIIPIFGYFKIRNERPPAPAEVHAKEISWCKWHIDLLEGRIKKDSLEYKLGINLPN